MRLAAPTQLIRDVGRRIGEVRSAGGLTQAELAERLDVALPYIARIEQGRQNITLRTLARIATALAVPARALFDPPTTPPPAPGRPRNAVPSPPARKAKRARASRAP